MSFITPCAVSRPDIYVEKEFRDLPDEVLCNILSFMEIKDIHNVSLVGRRFLPLFEPFLYFHLGMKQEDDPETREYPSTLKEGVFDQEFEEEKKLQIQKSENLWRGITDACPKYLEQVVDFDLAFGPNITITSFTGLQTVFTICNIAFRVFLLSFTLIHALENTSPISTAKEYLKSFNTWSKERAIKKEKLTRIEEIEEIFKKRNERLASGENLVDSSYWWFW
ncbi:MAG: hypothetical protein K940chlam3_01257 [Chlamydiae bacterium]|nr:hypothetical protein [Chlamydiota bacterium]